MLAVSFKYSNEQRELKTKRAACLFMKLQRENIVKLITRSKYMSKHRNMEEKEVEGTNHLMRAPTIGDE